MQFYDVTGLRPEIIRPGMTLTAWSQIHHPKALCNLSLFVNTSTPVGTVIENGVLVHDDGNGFGFGIKNGKIGFGGPWTDSWSDFVTGYNAPVQGGRYVAPTWKDTYVFNCALNRIGIGRMDGKIYIVTDNLVTLKGFAEHAIDFGFDTLVNDDGGLSRHLDYGGKTIYRSYRTHYNALAFFGELPETVTECPFPMPTYTLRYGVIWSDAVRWVQWQLRRRGFVSIEIDGNFGPMTRDAVKAFQAGEGIQVDGVVGPETRQYLLKN